MSTQTTACGNCGAALGYTADVTDAVTVHLCRTCWKRYQTFRRRKVGSRPACDKCYRRLYEDEVQDDVDLAAPDMPTPDGNGGYELIPPKNALYFDGDAATWGYYKHPEAEMEDVWSRYMQEHGYRTLKVMQPDGSWQKVTPWWERP